MESKGPRVFLTVAQLPKKNGTNSYGFPGMFLFGACGFRTSGPVQTVQRGGFFPRWFFCFINSRPWHPAVFDAAADCLAAKAPWNDEMEGKSIWIWSNEIVTSRDRTRPQMVVNSNGNPLILGKSRLVKYYSIWPDEWIRFMMICIIGGRYTHLASIERKYVLIFVYTCSDCMHLMQWKIIKMIYCW